ncbi:hypothetical protein [Anaeromyxobacter oryzae]|uniref:hypothetical protein n=1 Tax=Anaeromyxobacter oryzae TaxID=2918170 RepID=UPI0020C0FF04|nr:hypothetical protein [Anaeromyxobacter oryzae]
MASANAAKGVVQIVHVLRLLRGVPLLEREHLLDEVGGGVRDLDRDRFGEGEALLLREPDPQGRISSRSTYLRSCAVVPPTFTVEATLPPRFTSPPTSGAMNSRQEQA